MSDPKDIKKPVIILPENVQVDYTFEKMLKTFKKKVETDGILEEVKRRKYYIKPSEQKRTARKSKKRRN